MNYEMYGISEVRFQGEGFDSWIAKLVHYCLKNSPSSSVKDRCLTILNEACQNELC